MRAAVGDPATSWHALRGLDFAGLVSVLKTGLTPTKNSHSGNVSGVEYAVCMSGSPALSHANNREANSFSTYTLNETALSLALTAQGRLAPNGGFVDEHRSVLPIEPSTFKGIALNTALAQTILTEVQVTSEPMKPAVCADYITRTSAWVTEIAGADALDELGGNLERFREASAQNVALTREETAQLQTQFLAIYAKVLQERLGRQATVLDAVRDTTAQAGVDLPVLLWGDDLKQDIGRKNAAIARNAVRSRGVKPSGGFSAGPQMRTVEPRSFVPVQHHRRVTF